jgi:eukaryotic-like serine/threonine-protein kinase
MIDLFARLQAALGDAYTIERELGSGGMSRVFLAIESSLHRQVVIKVLPPELASEVSEGRFKQEIELAARLQHTNIIPVLTAGAKDHLLYYVMPFVTGESLRHRLIREVQLPIQDALRILVEIADALAYAHAEGVIHRDIKPENVLLLGGHAVLTDFGVARALAEARSGTRLTEAGMSVGTPGYMSPEQAAGERRVDARTDIYALAVVGYEMLAGVPPFDGPTAQAVLAAHLTQAPNPLKQSRPDVPDLVSEAIARALEKDPAKRFETAGEFRNAITILGPRRASERPIRRRLLAGVLAIGVIVVGGFLALRAPSAPRLDRNLVAVAPFDVLDSKLSLWHEGFVDVLSRNLDGAGPLRTVSPTIVLRRWSGRADPASAVELGRRTGAGLVVTATVVGVGRDSARLSASLTDVNDGRSVGDVDLRGESDHMDRLADSLTVALLRELGRTRPIGAVRLASHGSRSLPALRAFLRGEQFWRRSVWDSAIVSYERAIALDTSFALALSHLGRALTWKRTSAVDSLSLSYSLRAGAFNHGLAPRESLLVAADSLTAAALSGFPRDTLWWTHARRAHATLDEAARRYPEDPEVWYTLGELRVHVSLPGTALAKQLEPFERAITIDSAFAPAYYHGVQYGLALGDSAKVRRLLGAYLGLNATDVFADALRLAAKLFDPVAARSPEVHRILDTASAELLNLTRVFER